ncbi:MAG: ankyrin repeat domain-containing protein [Myxococcota bacterium]
MDVAQRVNTAWNRIEVWFGAHAPILARSLRPGAPEADIRATERVLRVRFPSDIVASLLRHDGQDAVGRRDRTFVCSRYRLLSLREMVSEAREWAALRGDFAQVPVDADPSVEAAIWTRHRIPLGKDGSGDLVSVDMRPTRWGTPGQLVASSHDGEGVPLVAPSWVVYLERLAEDLEAGRYPVAQDYGGLDGRRGGAPLFPLPRPDVEESPLPPFDERFPGEPGAPAGAEVQWAKSLAEALAEPERFTHRLAVEEVVLPPEIGRLRWLSALSVKEAPELPAEIGYLTRLDTLNAWDTGWRRLPSSFAAVGCDGPGLRLSLPGNPFDALPDVLRAMPHLVGLDLRRCRLGASGASGAELGEWPRLHALALANNGLEALPAGLEGLSALRALDLSRNALRPEAVERLGSLAGLESLNLSGCELTALPTTWTALGALQSLDVSNNAALARLPALHLPALQTLDVGYTPIVAAADLLPLLAGCPSLKRVRLSSTPIGYLDEELTILRARFPGVEFDATGGGIDVLGPEHLPLVTRLAKVKSATYAATSWLELWSPSGLAARGEAARLLAALDAGTPVDTPNEDGETLLHIVAENGHLELVELLLDRGAAIEATEKNSKTPLYLACEAASEAAARLLVARGADVKAQTRWRQGPVFAALEYGHGDLARWLLSVGAPPVGDNVLLHAAALGDTALIAEVLDGGAVRDERDYEGRDALGRAATEGHTGAVELLHRRGFAAAGSGALPWAAHRGHSALVRRLLALGAEVDETEGFGNTALARAATKGFADLVDLLLKAGANPAPHARCSALHGAAVEGHAPVVATLLAAGTPVDAPYDGKTALEVAARRGRTEVVEVLLAAGAVVTDGTVAAARSWGDAPLVARLEALLPAPRPPQAGPQTTS